MASATRVFMTRTFNHWAKDVGVTKKTLLEAAAELESGLNDGHLGKFLFKKRITLSMTNKGRSSGARIIIAMKEGDRVIFLYGFAKSAMGNIPKRDLKYYRERAKRLMGYNAAELEAQLCDNNLIEVKNVSTNTS